MSSITNHFDQYGYSLGAPSLALGALAGAYAWKYKLVATGLATAKIMASVTAVAFVALSTIVILYNLYHSWAEKRAREELRPSGERLEKSVAVRQSGDRAVFSLCVDSMLIPVELRKNYSDRFSIRIAGTALLERETDYSDYIGLWPTKVSVAFQIMPRNRDWLKIHMHYSHYSLPGGSQEIYIKHRLFSEAKAYGRELKKHTFSYPPRTITKEEASREVQKSFVSRPMELYMRIAMENMRFFVFEPSQGTVLGIDFLPKTRAFFYTQARCHEAVECEVIYSRNCCELSARDEDNCTLFSLSMTKTQNTAMEVLLNDSPAELFARSPLEEFYLSPENVLSEEVLSKSILYDKEIWKIIAEYVSFGPKSLAPELIALKLERNEMQTWVQAGCPAQ